MNGDVGMERQLRILPDHLMRGQGFKWARAQVFFPA